MRKKGATAIIFVKFPRRDGRQTDSTSPARKPPGKARRQPSSTREAYTYPPVSMLRDARETKNLPSSMNMSASPGACRRTSVTPSTRRVTHESSHEYTPKCRQVTTEESRAPDPGSYPWRERPANDVPRWINRAISSANADGCGSNPCPSAPGGHPCQALGETRTCRSAGKCL